MGRLRLAVLFGGVSSEHDVSLMSASSVLRHLDREKYEIYRIGITKDGAWYLFEGDDSLLKDDGWCAPQTATPAVLSPDRSAHGLLVLRSSGIETIPIDVVFPVLHGKLGEDGSIQGLCALAGIACVGCGILASAVCMDKEYTHLLLQEKGVPGAKWIAVRPRDAGNPERLAARLAEAGIRYPVFVKPANAGSSVGVTKINDPGALGAALLVAFHEDEKAIIEEALVGREVECAVMGNEEPLAAVSVGEIEPLRELYDYEGKYCDSTAALHVPARIPDAAAQAVREAALKAYRALGCRGLARVDFFVLEDGTFRLNELNTIPGFTSISMFPRLFCHEGMTYAQLLDRLIQYASEV